jgi:hypothetical protein
VARGSEHGHDRSRRAELPDAPYDRENPDKYRTDPHDGAIPFDWTLRDG